MGYVCPVCAAPQADGEHLANHLAFTAMLHGDEHEAWLDEHVPDWGDRDPDALAADVVEVADEVDHETVFDDTTAGGGFEPEDVQRHASDGPPRALDPETRRVVEEAREMTRERRSGDGSTDPGEERGE